jgi:predicted RNA-binding Zn-ribbon protein involved in translation (DUF1610 family)
MTANTSKKNTDTDNTEVTEKGKDESPFYCPGCGRRWNYRTECAGQSAGTPHPPIEVISTDELSGDPEKHTPAPSTGV